MKSSRVFPNRISQCETATSATVRDVNERGYPSLLAKRTQNRHNSVRLCLPPRQTNRLPRSRDGGRCIQQAKQVLSLRVGGIQAQSHLRVGSR